MDKQDIEQQIVSLLQFDMVSRSLGQPLVIGDFKVQANEFYARRELLKQSMILPFSRVLDIGCNFGLNSFIISSEFPTSMIDGIDISEIAILMAQQLQRYYEAYGTRFLKRDFGTIQCLADYDVILVSYIVSTHKEFMRQYYNYATKRGFDGKFIVLYPPWDDNRSQITRDFFEQEVERTLKQFDHASRIGDMILI